MIKTLEKSGRTEDDAIAAALRELGLDRDDVSVEIIERAKSGFLGIGASPAVVRPRPPFPLPPLPLLRPRLPLWMSLPITRLSAPSSPAFSTVWASRRSLTSARATTAA